MSCSPTGCLDVLNIGHGHLKFRFDREDADEVAKAKRVITDMLGRGYMLFVLHDGEQRRVRKFDPDQEEYILEEPDVPDAEAVEPAAPRRRRGTGPRAGRVPMRQASATAIAPTAGG